MLKFNKRKKSFDMGLASLALILLTSCLLLVSCGQAQPITTETSPAVTPAIASVGAVAPDFVAQDLSGKSVALKDLRGKPVILNFWAVYCAYCRQEMPDLIKTYQANKADLQIIGFNMNDERADVDKYLQEFGVPYPTVIDSTGDMTYKYRVRGHPTTFFINKQGMITGTITGLASPEQLAQELAKVQM